MYESGMIDSCVGVLNFLILNNSVEAPPPFPHHASVMFLLGLSSRIDFSILWDLIEDLMFKWCPYFFHSNLPILYSLMWIKNQSVCA